MDLADRIVVALALALTILYAAVEFSLNNDRAQKLEARVDALEAEDK